MAPALVGPRLGALAPPLRGTGAFGCSYERRPHDRNASLWGRSADIRESATSHEHLVDDGSMINDGVTPEGLRDYLVDQAEAAYEMKRKVRKGEADFNEQWVEGRLGAFMQFLEVLDPQAADVLRAQADRSLGPLADEPN